MFKPEGVFVAMLTPFLNDGTINEEEVRRMVDFLIDSKVSGLFPVSTVGESIHMTRNEKIRLIEIVIDQTAGRVPVTPGVGSSHPQEAVLLAQKAKAFGCDGVVVAPPHFYPLSQEMVESYFDTIAKAVDLPIILYNIPLFTQPIGYDVVEHLSRYQHIVAMKDSSGSMVDFLHYMDKVSRAGKTMNFLTGREEILLPFLMMGGKGCMAATPGILPEVMVGIFKAWKEGNSPLAKHLQVSILPLVRTMFSVPFPLGFKLALEVRGFTMGPPKQPLPENEQLNVEEARKKIKVIINSILDEL